MLSVAAWKWGRTFEARHVNVLRAALAKHLHMDHELVCITDDPASLDGDIRVVPMPEQFAQTPRCRRRMQNFDREFASEIGARTLWIDLDVVIVDDLTPVVNRPEKVVGWKVGHAGVMSGSFLLMDAGALDPLWQRFKADPEGFPRLVQKRGIPSDQAMLNYYLAKRSPIPFWTERDGFVTYYGSGYEHLEHLGVGPNRPELPPGTRIVVLGSADKVVLDEGRFDWVREHWQALEKVAA